MSTNHSCAFCYERDHYIQLCNSPEIARLCNETREYAYYSYLFKNQNILFNHLRGYSFNILKMLYIHWEHTGTSSFRESVRSHVPNFPSLMSYSRMIALNMWLYLYIELHQIRYNSRMDDQNRDNMTFWYNVWTGYFDWRTTPSSYDDISDGEGSVDSSDFAPDTIDTSINVYSESIRDSSQIFGDGGGYNEEHGNSEFAIQLADADADKASAAAHKFDECPICYDKVPLEKKVLLKCSHILCTDCFQAYVGSKPDNSLYSCSMCRANIDSIVLFCPDAEKNFTKYKNPHSPTCNDGLLDLIDSVEFDMNLFG